MTFQGGALAPLRYLACGAAMLALQACATGSSINVAGSGGDPSFAEETLEDTTGQGEPSYLVASGNIMLPWRDAASMGAQGLGGTVAGLTGATPPNATQTGLGLQAGLTPKGSAVALGVNTPLAGTTVQAALAPGAVTAGVGLSTPVVGANTALGVSPQGATVATSLTTPVATVGATLNAGRPLGGLGAAPSVVGAIAGPVANSVANPNTVTGALLTDLTGAAMQMSPSPAMTAPMVPSSQNLGAVLGLLKRPGA